MGLSRTHLTTGVKETIHTEIYHYHPPGVESSLWKDGFDGWGNYIIVDPENNQIHQIRAFNKNTGVEITNEAIDQDLLPSFTGRTISDRIFTVGEATEDITVLPSALSGDPPLTYNLTPALPGGLQFNSNTRVISGTPTTVTSKTAYTYTVTDTDGDTDEITFNVTVVDSTVPTFGTQTIAHRLFSTGSSQNIALPEATGGNTPLVYSLTPALPSGLSFNVITRVISGTPDAVTPAKTYTYTVTDADGDTSELKFMVEVEANNIPDFGSETITDKKYVTGTIVIEMLPVATGGNGALTYSLTPALPVDLSFNATTRVIRGILFPGESNNEYTYTVTDEDGDTDQITFRITVETNSIPSFGETIPD